MTATNDLAARVARLEEQMARLATDPARPRTELGEEFAFLTALEESVPPPGGVMMVGSVTTAAGPVRWQVGQRFDMLQEWDWPRLAPALSALAHPIRLTILKLVLDGTETTANLLADPALASAGKLHHHLRQLVAAGWLDGAIRGRYTIPPERVVPLLVILVAAHR